MRTTWVWCIAFAGIVSLGWGQTADQQFDFAESLRQSGEDEFAILEYKRFIFQYSDDVRTPSAFRHVAQLSISARGDIATARRILGALIERYPDTDHAAQATTFLDFIEINSDFDGQPLVRWLAAQSQEKQQAMDRAAAHYAAIVRDFPQAQLADDALMRKALLLRDELKRPEEAHADLTSLPTTYPNSSLLSDACFEAAMTLAAIAGREAEVPAALRAFAQTYPQDARAAKANAYADELDKKAFVIQRQFDALFVKEYVIKRTHAAAGLLTIDVELAVGLSQRNVQATLEDVLIKEAGKRSAVNDNVVIKAYFNFPISPAGDVTWTPGQGPVYTVQEQQTEEVIRDVFLDILKRRR